MQSRILTNVAKVFTRLWKHSSDNMFYFFIKLLFSILTKRKTLYEAHMYTYLNFFHETETSHNWETQPTIIFIATSISCFIALWKHTYRPIKTHVLSKLFYRIQIIEIGSFKANDLRFCVAHVKFSELIINVIYYS